MFYLDWVLTLVVLGVFALAAWPMQLIAESARRRTRAAQLQVSVLTGLLAETFGAMRFVKTYGLEAHETERSRKTFEERRKAQMKLARNRAHPVPLLEIIGGLALAVVLAIAGRAHHRPSNDFRRPDGHYRRFRDGDAGGAGDGSIQHDFE